MLRPSEASILTGPRLRDTDDRATGLLEAECGLLALGRKGAFRFLGVPLAFALDGVGLTCLACLVFFVSVGLAGDIFVRTGVEAEDLAGDACGSLDAAVFVAPTWLNLRAAGGGGRKSKLVSGTCYVRSTTRKLVPGTWYVAGRPGGVSGYPRARYRPVS